MLHNLTMNKWFDESIVDTLLSFLLYDRIVQGPSVLVVKDKEGSVYGGYASQPWEKRSDFYGDMKSFLFTLHPKAAIHRPTGKNTNLQWVSSLILFSI